MTDLLYGAVEEQLRSSVRDLLADRSPWTAVLARTETDEPYDPALWATLARELGVAGLAVAEARGGHGASWREAAVVAEELGGSVAGTPFLGSAVLATALAQAVGAADLLRSLASGEATAAVAVGVATAPGDPYPASVRASGATGDGVRLTGTVRSVADAVACEHLLVPAAGPDGPALCAVETAAARRAPVTSLDLTRPLVDLTFDATPGRLLVAGQQADTALEHALTVGAALLAAEQVGLAQRCLDLAVEHLKTRYQFARPVGSFQALKHRMADLWADITQARAVARYAVACVAEDDPDAAVAASLAQAYCSPVAVKAAEECVQMHGGIGFTWEHPAHLYLKRAKADAVALGTASRHRARLAALVDLPAS